MISFFADVLILGALGFVGWGQVSRGRSVAAARKAEEGAQAALAAVQAVKNELVMLAAIARNEGAKLREATAEAASVAEASVGLRKSLSFEAAKAGALVREVEAAAASADRACGLLAETVSRAAAVQGRIETADEEGAEEACQSVRPRRRVNKGGIRLVKG